MGDCLRVALAKAPGFASKEPGAGVSKSLKRPKRLALLPKLELRLMRVEFESGDGT